MNVKAALNTAKVLGLCTLVSLSVFTVFQLVPLEYIGGALSLAMVVMAARLCYDTEKSKLEALDRLNNLSKE